ncbi:MAG TPA: hypothetical protein PLQ54_02545 [Armatimonadota bacterium]|nr:hypothetical protein [Armatimonadota bacterium]
MRIVATTPVQDCFDGSTVFTYWFDTVWTPDLVQVLRCLGELEYFSDFPRPFFRLRCGSGLQVKGVVGEDNCQVILPRAEREVIRESFERCFAP